MTTTAKITMPVVSLRRINTPFEQEGKKIYLAVIKAKDLPKDFEEWRGINPRDPNKSSGVAKRIAESLQNQPECFLFRNRGLTLLSEKVSFNNESNILAVEFSDKTMHGLLDGGHTYAVIREVFDSLIEDDKVDTNLNNAYVKLEILEGITSKDETTEIVGARNTSTQVRDQSLANLMLLKTYLKMNRMQIKLHIKKLNLMKTEIEKISTSKRSYLTLFVSIVKVLMIIIIQLLPTPEKRLFSNMQMPKIIAKGYKSIFRYCQRY